MKKGFIIVTDKGESYDVDGTSLATAARSVQRNNEKAGLIEQVGNVAIAIRADLLLQPQTTSVVHAFVGLKRT